MALEDNLEEKDAEIKKLQDDVALIENFWNDTSANRERAAQSEARVAYIKGMSEEMQKEAISIAKQAFLK